MAEINNFSEISENFDTIKTLLNSIRAQGILNTSDVDKLLSGINAKLEKINTEEDIDLIKIFLSELKQNLDERHSTLLSKFGAIESLFSNLLKNSSEMLKSSEVKELFDIIATNLSVFSREVVSQKETLTDITLRLDAMRSDDTQKKEIIKNISLLKNDLEKLNNGFDSIVLSLNENFKTLIKTISSIDNTETINKFGTNIRDIVSASNTILSALQVLDKKNVQITENIALLATAEDVTNAKKQIAELLLQNKEISNSLENLSTKTLKIDNLADKIDASVSIIAGLKTVIADSNEENTHSIIEKLANLEIILQEISSNKAFEDFKRIFEEVLNEINSSSLNLQNIVSNASNDIQSINDNIKALDLNTGLKVLSAEILDAKQDLKDHANTLTDKLTQFTEIGVTRTLNELSASAEVLNSTIKETHTSVTNLCAKHFSEILNDIAGLKTVVVQIDENNVSANNAIFSNITDRLAIFENSLKNSLEKQEDCVSDSSDKLIEQISSLKDLSGVIDYKLDSSLIQINDAKKEYDSLKKSIDNMLALDFINVVKDLRVDLYASKQELSNTMETLSTDMSDKISNDLFAKYELLISKLDNLEDSLQQAQTNSLNNLKSILDNISASLMDVLSYVSEQTKDNTENIDAKLANITEIVKDSNLNYVENVRDVVDVIRTQVENNIIQLEQETSKQVASINSSIEKSSQSVKEEIRYTYNKLLEVQDKFSEIQELLNVNNANMASNVNNLLGSADNLKSEFETKLSILKQALLEQITTFKQELTCENADKISEIKFNSETLNSKLIKHSNDLKNEILVEVEEIISRLKSNVSDLAEQLAGTALQMEGANKEIISYIRNDFCAEVDASVDNLKSNISEFKNTMDDKVSDVVTGLTTLEKSVSALSNTTTSSLTSTLAKILENFTALKSVIETNQNNTSNNINSNSEKMVATINSMQQKLENIVSDLSETSETSLTSAVATILENFADLKLLIDTNYSNASSDSSSNTEKIITVMETLQQNLEKALTNLSESTKSSLLSTLTNILDNFSNLKSVIDDNHVQISEDMQANIGSVMSSFKELQIKIEKVDSNVDEDLTRQYSLIETSFENLTTRLENIFSSSNENLSQNLTNGLTSITDTINETVTQKLEQYKINLETVFDNINSNSNSNADFIKDKIKELDSILQKSLNYQTQLANDRLAEMTSELKKILSENVELTSADYESLKSKINEFLTLTEQNNSNIATEVKTSLDDMIKYISSGIDIQSQEINSKFEDINSRIQKLSNTFVDNGNQIKQQVELIDNEIVVLKNTISTNSSDIEKTLINKIADTEELISHLNDKLTASFENSDEKMRNNIEDALNAQQNVFDSRFSTAEQFVQTSISTLIENKFQSAAMALDERFAELKSLISIISTENKDNSVLQEKHIIETLELIKNSLESQVVELQNGFKEEIIPEVANLKHDLQAFLEGHALNLLTQVANNNASVTDNFNIKIQEIMQLIKDLDERLNQEEISKINTFKSEISNLQENLNSTVSKIKDFSTNELQQLKDDFIRNNQSLINIIDKSLDDKFDMVSTIHADMSSKTTQSIDTLSSNLISQLDMVKQNSNACKDIINKLIEQNLETITKEIEKETDIIVGDIIEQFGLFKDSQKDELTKLSVHIESSVEDYIYNYLNDLKSYLDVKTDNTVVSNKLDNLKSDLSHYLEDTLANINKLIEVNADTKVANEVLITSMIDKFHIQIQSFFEQNKEFISENVARKFEEKLNLFDKKFVDIVVDNYEEIKVISSAYNKSFENIQLSIHGLISQFTEVKDNISKNIVALIGEINGSINELHNSFDALRAQVLDKNFDKEFQTSINNQILEVESLVNKQMEYLEDISDLCGNTLPELTEMNTIVKYGVQQAIIDLSEKFDKKDVSYTEELNTLKTDIITQFLNIFNQISFVAEQEEILDFIQDKHSELITILSHIVTTSDGIETVKDNVAIVDNKLNALKEDVDLINEKISSIISSQGDIEYVYSLQDIESDIANLRLVLNDMKKSFDSKEIGTEEFKNRFEALTEDILSISSRTNKLILATDESNKNLKDNLQEFKLVINDLDERTRNFAHEVGIDKLDNKLISLNSMMQNGVKTNQIFNQVFEYLAEWVDRAGEQIADISQKVEALDDIGQVKVMLQDLKAEAEDNTESVELIEALGNIFEKQAKKISSLEAKLDRVIVETTINQRNNKIDMTPFEETLNRFLVAIDDKMVSQQNKINSLEEKLEEVISMIDPKDTVQLTKKVGGMDRQIAKLNKSIEKIASHVVEK